MDPHLGKTDAILTECLHQSCVQGLYQVKLKHWTLALTDEIGTPAPPVLAPVKPPGHGPKKNPKKDKELPNLVLTPPDMDRHQQVKRQRELLMRHVLCLLYAARYGLSRRDIRLLLEDVVPLDVRERMWGFLRPHVMEVDRKECHEKLYCLSHNSCRLFVRQAFLQDEALLTRA